jgi:hypothetical protein
MDSQLWTQENSFVTSQGVSVVVPRNATNHESEARLGIEVQRSYLTRNVAPAFALAFPMRPTRVVNRYQPFGRIGRRTDHVGQRVVFQILEFGSPNIGFAMPEAKKVFADGANQPTRQVVVALSTVTPIAVQ